MNIRIIPIVIYESERLKTGKFLTLIKSITYPYFNLSIKFPKIPEKIKERLKTIKIFFGFILMKKYIIKIIAINDITMKKFLPSGKIPKTPPLFSTFSNFNMSFNILNDFPKCKFFITKYFDILSKKIKIDVKIIKYKVEYNFIIL